METKNFETYCGRDLITLLLKSGFDWKDYFVAHSIDEQFHWEIPLHIAQKWLRDVKQIFICIIPEIKDYHATWIFYIYNEQGLFYENDDCFLTYEEALEAGIKKVCKIILSKK